MSFYLPLPEMNKQIRSMGHVGFDSVKSGVTARRSVTMQNQNIIGFQTWLDREKVFYMQGEIQQGTDLTWCTFLLVQTGDGFALEHAEELVPATAEEIGQPPRAKFAMTTDEELKVLDLLAQAYNEFNKLPVLHHADHHEFVHSVHACMNVVLARTGLRSTGIYRPAIGGTPGTDFPRYSYEIDGNFGMYWVMEYDHATGVRRVMEETYTHEAKIINDKATQLAELARLEWQAELGTRSGR